MRLGWDDYEEIAELLADAHPDVDPLGVRFTELHAWVCALPGFAEDRGRAVALDDDLHLRVGKGGLDFGPQWIIVPAWEIWRPNTARLCVHNTRNADSDGGDVHVSTRRNQLQAANLLDD